MMSERLYRLLERLQKLDARLRLAQARRRPDPMELAVLASLKRAVRRRIAAASAPSLSMAH